MLFRSSIRNVPGKPYSSMKACASVYDDTGPGVPGTTGTPTRIADHGKPSQSPPSRTREKFQMQIKQIKHIDKVFSFFKKRKKKRNLIIPSWRAFVLSPNWSITSGDGPMNASPACSTFLANSAFSERKPYLHIFTQSEPFRTDGIQREGGGRISKGQVETHPGWIMSTPCSSAILMISSWARYAPTGVRPFPT